MWEKHGNSQENHEFFDGFWWMFLWFPKSWGYPSDHLFIDGFSMINHPFGDTPIYGNPHVGLSENGGKWPFIFDLPSKNGE